MVDDEKTISFSPSYKLREFEAIVAEHQSGLLRYAARILNDENAAQDVVQNTFIKLLEGWKNGSKPTQKLKGWLFRVTHNNAVDYIRREDRLRVLHKKQAEEMEVAAPAAQARGIGKSEAMQLALEHLRKLDPSEQQVVILRLQEGKTYKEIAEITQRSEGNVGCIIHHAVKKISASLKRSGVI